MTPKGLFVGLATLDIVYRIERLPHPNEKITAHRQDLAAGGPATNAAVTFAALGGEAVLLTALGPSPVAKVIRDEVERAGVRVIDVAPSLSYAPPVSSVMVDEATGERAVVGGDAAGTRLDPVPDAVVRPQLVDVDVVLLDGHHPQLTTPAGRLAHRADIPVVIDAGRWKPVMQELIGCADDVVASADFRVPGANDPDQTARLLSAMGVPVVVTTAGADPVRWRRGDDCGVVDMAPVEVVDTLGAGDVFHGAYAHALVAGFALVDRIRFAGRAAGIRCSHIGPRSWLGAVARLADP